MKTSAKKKKRTKPRSVKKSKRRVIRKNTKAQRAKAVARFHRRPKVRRPYNKKIRTAASAPRPPAYVLNSDFGSFGELRDLILKSLPAEKNDMIEKINRLGKIKLAVISGVFINKENLDPLIADLLIVGDYIESRKLRSFLKSLEAEVGKEIKYSVMDKEEFQYRLAMFDRFVRVLLDGPHEKLINRLGI